MRTWIGTKALNRIYVKGQQVAEILYYSSNRIIRAKVKGSDTPQIVFESTDKHAVIEWLNENIPGWYQLGNPE